MIIRRLTDNDIALIPTPIVCDTHLSLGASGLYARLACAKATNDINFLNLIKNNNKLDVKIYLLELIKRGYIRITGNGKNKTIKVID